MPYNTDDEWVFAVAILTLCPLVIVTVWMVVFFVQYNRKSSRRKEVMEKVEDIMKPSSNGRSKKDN